MICETVSSLT